MMFFEKILLLVSLLLLVFSPSNAMAYIGPGMGLSAIGTVVAFTGAILLAIVGFVWYPLKRLLAKRKTKNK